MKFKPMKPPAGSLPDSEMSRLRFPLYGSYKLDGIRAMVQDGILVSASLKPIPNRELQKMWGRPEFEGLDGEIIAGSPFGEGVFNRTTSLVMAANRAAKGMATFFIFDKFHPTLDYEHRLLLACETLVATGADKLDCPIAIHGFRKLHTLEEAIAFETEAVQLGYEGMMLRKLTGLYKQGRSTMSDQGLLRRKPFEDAEAVVIATFEEKENTNMATTNELGRTKRSSAQAGKVGKGTLGGFVVKGLTAFEGVEFNIATFGTQEEAAAMWAMRDQLKGKVLKFKFQRYGSINSPRIPIALGFRDERDMSR